MAPLSVYKASAGSGKTYRLTLGYLELLFRNPQAYRHILAVTFTNKAASEMKSRILEQLHALSRLKEGESSDLLLSLERSTGRTREQIIENAGALLVRILNDYSRFSVGTIDRFFQGVIRAFTREIGLQAGFSLELDRDRILGEAIDRMFLDLGEDQELLDWMLKLAESRIEASRGWNFKNEILGLGQELFSEAYQEVMLERDVYTSREQLESFIGQLDIFSRQVEEQMKELAADIGRQMEAAGYEPDDFYRKASGPAGFFQKVASGEKTRLTPAVRASITDPSKWTSRLEPDAGKIRFAEETLMPGLGKIYNLTVLHQSALEVRQYIFALGILNDIAARILDITDEKNQFLLSDAARFLKGLIGNNPTPFIYEKTGNYIEHIMLDEFQDTSVFQWENFRPLLEHTLSTGKENIIVGDIKQSIYRWRNSDWKILAEAVGRSFPGHRIRFEPLVQNWRSRELVIRFNNTLFSRAPEIIRELVGAAIAEARVDDAFRDRWGNLLASAYEGVVQEIPGKSFDNGGYIRAEILEEEGTKQRELALEKIPWWIMELQDAGYGAGDIAILVRTNDEGADVARILMETDREDFGPKYNFNFISNESLFLHSNIAVKLIVCVLKYLQDDRDELNNITLRYYHRLLKAGEGETAYALAPGRTVDEELGEEFTRRIPEMKRLPLFELVEFLISHFGLDGRMEDLPYLQAFQEVVLDLQQDEPGSLHDFILYWSEYGTKKSITVSEDQDAIRIITIHKAKGLQFKSVLIPFCDWKLTSSGSGFNETILWCDTSGTPFAQLPVAPLKFKKDLEGTIFAEAYLEEVIMGFVDNLNLLYVAFTRAEEAMIIGLPGPAEAGKLRRAGELVMMAAESAKEAGDPLLMDLPGTVTEQGFEIGALEKQATVAQAYPDPWIISGYPVKFRNESIRLRMKSSDYFLQQGTEGGDHLDFGNVMHELFGKIRTIGDVEGAVKQYLREGLLTEVDAEKLHRLVNEKLNTPGVAEWFVPGIRVFNENDIIAGGETFRPDRVIILADRVVVIDYKFGDMELAKYDRQVSRYVKLLREMGYNNVEGRIWYVMLDKIVKVV